MAKLPDVKSLSDKELRNLLANARRLGREDVAMGAVRELTARGRANGSDYDLLDWNQETARTALLPFVEVSKGVKDNQRTVYTEAGGLKIGKSRGDPEWMWVDTYSAIKTAKLNAVFVCYIPRPGDEAYFGLIVNGQTERRYQPNELETALMRWRAISDAAE